MKRVILSAVLFFLLPFTSALANDGYVFILKARGNPYWTSMAEGIQETSKLNHIQAVVYQLENDRAAEEQLNVCMTAIERKPKLLAISAVTPSVGIQCIKKAAAAGIIVADMDSNISVDAAKAAGVSLAYTVGSDNFLIGQEAAEYVSKTATKRPLKIFVLEGAAGSIPGQKRVDGFRAKLKELIPTANVTSLSAEWDMLKAVSATSDLLLRQPDVDIIYAANDKMALGAAEAVRSAGKQDQIAIIGVDGTSDARKAIMEGRLSASVAQLPYLIGKRAVELGVEVVKNGKTGIVEVTATPVLTKAMIEANTDPVLHYVR
ncbi:MAG: substrate-binding domain-containing protein [Alphaproteobacteria bacterium]|nr:substrate-binding domain-containing protein [Alphaproteobacteria bacterium]